MIRIFLTGYMGAGKTTLGKAFARELNIPFIDLDWYIEERLHKSIRELFTERGEASFRELERTMLHEVAEFENVIISTGGGTPCFFDNMEQRPILQGKTDEDLRAFIVEALEKRAPHYGKARYRFDAGQLESRRQIADSVQQLRNLLGI